MALSDLSAENCLLVIGVVGAVNDWGRTDPPLVIEQIDPSGVLSRGLGGNAAAFFRKNSGLRITVNLMPGSPQAAAFQAASNSRTIMAGTYASLEGLEGGIFSEGIITMPKSMGRAGPGMNDATFVMEFNRHVVQ